MNGKPKRAVDESSLQRLLDPPCRVRVETKATPKVELVGGPHEPDVALLHQIEKRNALVFELAGKEQDEPQVAHDEPLFGGMLRTLSSSNIGQHFGIGLAPGICRRL